MGEVEVGGKFYPATTQGSRVARCYVCNEVVAKTSMMMIGPAPLPEVESEERLYIFRCRECYAGSPKWMKHFMHKSTLRKLFMNLEGYKMDVEIMKGVGRKIVEATKEKHESEIVARLDSREGTKSTARATDKEVPKAASRTHAPVVAAKRKGVVNGRRRTVVIRRTR